MFSSFDPDICAMSVISVLPSLISPLYSMNLITLQDCNEAESISGLLSLRGRDSKIRSIQRSKMFYESR